MARPARVLLAALLALLLLVPAAGAVTPRTTLNDVEDEVMCPTCGTPLNLATDAPLANDERALIRRLIDQGYTKDQIKHRLVQEFGPNVLALPRAHGFDLSAYLVPIVLGVAGLLAIAVLAVRWRRRRPADAEAVPDLDPADAQRLDSDLARFDG
ncbi:MAG TPA: cytochrome c-type biogenesis protein CcmH [Solirubrobacteraceae bacterium]|nr:cytochrome c-type biogenesis protein CcmH [Solirubrobacteraceae bacterium]